MAIAPTIRTAQGPVGTSTSTRLISSTSNNGWDDLKKRAVPTITQSVDVEEWRRNFCLITDVIDRLDGELDAAKICELVKEGGVLPSCPSSTHGYYSPAACPESWVPIASRPLYGGGPPQTRGENAYLCCPRDHLILFEDDRCDRGAEHGICFSGVLSDPQGTVFDSLFLTRAIQIRWADSDLEHLPTHPLRGYVPEESLTTEAARHRREVQPRIEHHPIPTPTPTAPITNFITDTAHLRPRQVDLLEHPPVATVYGLPQPDGANRLHLILCFLPVIIALAVSFVGFVRLARRKRAARRPAERSSAKYTYKPLILTWPSLLLLAGTVLTCIALTQVALEVLHEDDRDIMETVRGIKLVQRDDTENSTSMSSSTSLNTLLRAGATPTVEAITATPLPTHTSQTTSQSQPKTTSNAPPTWSHVPIAMAQGDECIVAVFVATSIPNQDFLYRFQEEVFAPGCDYAVTANHRFRASLVPHVVDPVWPDQPFISMTNTWILTTIAGAGPPTVTDGWVDEEPPGPVGLKAAPGGDEERTQFSDASDASDVLHDPIALDAPDAPDAPDEPDEPDESGKPDAPDALDDPDNEEPDTARLKTGGGRGGGEWRRMADSEFGPGSVIGPQPENPEKIQELLDRWVVTHMIVGQAAPGIMRNFTFVEAAGGLPPEWESTRGSDSFLGGAGNVSEDDFFRALGNKTGGNPFDTAYESWPPGSQGNPSVPGEGSGPRPPGTTPGWNPSDTEPGANIGSVVYIMTRGHYFVVAFLPNLLIVFFTIPWRVIHHQVVSMEPFFRMSRGGGVTVQKISGFRYRLLSGVIPPHSPLWHRDWAIAWASLLEYICAILAPIASEAVGVGLEGSCSGSGHEGCAPVAEVVPVPTRIAQALLGTMLVLMLALWYTLSKRQSGLRNDPRTFMGVASLLGDTEVRRTLQTLDENDLVGVKALNRRLGSMKFKLSTAHPHDGLADTRIRAISASYTFNSHPYSGSEKAKSRRKKRQSGGRDRLTAPLRVTWSCVLLLGFALIHVLIAALILYYYRIGRRDVIWEFMASQRFGVRFLFVSVGVLINFGWMVVFDDAVVMIPIWNLARGSCKAEDSVLRLYSTDPYTELVRSLRLRQWLTAFVCFTTVLSDFLPPFLANVPFSRLFTREMNEASILLSISILLLMVVALLLLAFLLVSYRPRSFIPLELLRKNPFLGVMVLASHSGEVLEGLTGLSTMMTTEQVGVVKGMGLHYRLVWERMPGVGRGDRLEEPPRAGGEVDEDLPSCRTVDIIL